MSLARIRRSISPEVLYVIAVTIWGIAFLPLMWRELLFAMDTHFSADFEIFARASEAAWSGRDMYSIPTCEGCAYRYSPLFAYLFAPIATLGVTVWTGLHLAAVFALPLRIARIVPLLWPFWWDVGVGSNLFFIVVMAYYAMGGKTWAIAAILATALLVPRPLMVPIVAWLLWQHREARLPFAVAALGTLAFAYASGHLVGWAEILASSGSELGVPYNVGPSAIVGLAWIPIGLALAVWLFWRGRMGLAALAVSPYWLPYYLMMPIVDFRRSVQPEAADKSSLASITTESKPSLPVDSSVAASESAPQSADGSTN